MAFIDGLTVVMVSLVCSVVVEVLLWSMIYNTPQFKALKESIEKAKKKVDGMKEGRLAESTSGRNSATTSSSASSSKPKKSKDKKLDKAEHELANANRQVIQIRFKSTLILGVTLFSLYSLLSNVYDGVVVAKLPFVPYQFVKRLSHRSLAIDAASDDDDAEDVQTDCAMSFIYALCAMAFRVNLQKLLGTSPPTGNAFALAAGEELKQL